VSYWLDALERRLGLWIETSPQMEMNLLPSQLMQRGRIMLVQGNRVKDLRRDSKKEEKEDATIATCSTTMTVCVLTRRILQGMMTTTTTTISKAMGIKGTTGSTTKEREMLPLLEMEMVDLLGGQEMPGMMRVML